MSQVRFFFDENINPVLVDVLLRREPVDVIRVGWKDAPPLGTLDPDLLVCAETEHRLFVTLDRRTMPEHLTAHFAAGRHTWGVAMLRQGFPLQDYVEALLMIWGASEAEEWMDRMFHLPESGA